MTRAANDFLDANVGRSMDHRDTIITCSDDSFRYFNKVRFAHVNAVGVGTITGGLQINAENPEIPTHADHDMEPFGINGFYPTDDRIGYLDELQCLQSYTTIFNLNHKLNDFKFCLEDMLRYLNQQILSKHVPKRKLRNVFLEVIRSLRQASGRSSTSWHSH